VDLRVSGNHNAEVVTVLLSDEFDQVGCVVEAIFDRLPILVALRRVSSEGEDVLDPVVLSLGE